MKATDLVAIIAVGVAALSFLLSLVALVLGRRDRKEALERQAELAAAVFPYSKLRYQTDGGDEVLWWWSLDFGGGDSHTVVRVHEMADYVGSNPDGALDTAVGADGPLRVHGDPDWHSLTGGSTVFNVIPGQPGLAYIPNENLPLDDERPQEARFVVAVSWRTRDDAQDAEQHFVGFITAEPW